MIDLKPCPFCGYDAVNIFSFQVPVYLDRYFVHCSKCQATGPNCQTKEAAANLWNECSGRKEKE